MYIESSTPRKRGDFASLSSHFLQGSPSPRCFKFWYHMKGAKMGTVKVELETASKRVLVWSLSGDQSDGWKQGVTPIPPIDGAYKVRL